jgi:PAS domain S-box-containing protein
LRIQLASGAYKWTSFRVRLVAFALVCAVPVLMLISLQMRGDARQLSQRAADNAQVVVDRMEVRLGLVLGAAESVLHAIGALTMTGAQAHEACALALARAMAAAGPHVQNFGLVDATGAAVCGARGADRHMSIGHRADFQAVVRTRRPYLTGVIFGPLVGRHVLALAVPVLSADGRLLAVAIASIDALTLTQDLAPVLEHGMSFSLLDREGRLVSAAPVSPRLSPGAGFADSPLFRHAVAHGASRAQLEGLDGTLRHYAVRPLVYRGEPVLWLAAGVDTEVVNAAGRAARWRDLAVVLLLAGAVVALAMMATPPLVLARMRKVLGVARQVAAGGLDQRVKVTVEDELTPVETAMNQMLDAIEADRRVLATSESRYRMLFEHSLDGVLQLTPDGLVETANPAACEILGRTPEQLQGLAREQLLDPDDPAVERLLRECDERGHARAELSLPRGDGRRVDVEAATSTFTDGAGLRHRCVVLHDVTERNAAQEGIRRLNRELEARVARRTQQLQAANRELEAFTYSVSHDLRAPVAVVRSFAEVLEESGAVQGDKNRHFLRRIRAAGQRMNELIDGLLALANISRSQLDWEVVDLSELAREIAQDLAEAAPAGRVQVEVQPGLQALGDARLLRVVLHNLIGNAVKFSSRDPAPRVEVGVTTGAAGEPVFHVRDNGEGFDPTQAHRLFVAFQRLHTTAEFPGLGIGLATVQRIVQRHGGRIWAEAQPGRGATFRFVLGARDVPSQPSPLDAAAPA